MKNSFKNSIDDVKKHTEMEFSNALIIHALTPIFTFLLVIGLILSIFTTLPIEQITPWISMLSAWMPVANPLAVIFCIKAYRKSLWCNAKKKPSTTFFHGEVVQTTLNGVHIEV
uniref:Uncharacterized protein n=1 Tax=Acrobeloides nanus TaxID=290746 RepID=A0A914C6X2_9BILA